jgi:hypothetical protein
MYLSAIDIRGSDMARDRGCSYKAAGCQASALLAYC